MHVLCVPRLTICTYWSSELTEWKRMANIEIEEKPQKQFSSTNRGCSLCWILNHHKIYLVSVYGWILKWMNTWEACSMISIILLRHNQYMIWTNWNGWRIAKNIIHRTQNHITQHCCIYLSCVVCLHIKMKIHI